MSDALQTYRTIYSRDTTGNIRVWWMERDGDKYRTVSGIKDGELVQSEWRVATPMNVGRSNETTGEEQADLEVKSAYAKKLRMKYHESEADVDKDKYFKPMLAQDYTKRYTLKKTLPFPVESQPKLDGVRCIVTAEGAWSRTGKPILAVPHILESLAPLFAENPTLVLDGELYNHDFKDNFDGLISMIRKLKPSDADLEQSAQYVQYHVYDCPSEDTSFNLRFSTARDLVSRLNTTSVVLVQTLTASNQEQLDEQYQMFMHDGYEGQMVRINGPEYEQKRSVNLLKRKEFEDAEFEIVRIEEGQGNWSGAAKRVVIKLENGELNEAGMRGTYERGVEILANADAYVGGQATIRYQNRTPDGKLRFPVAVALYEGGRDL